MNETRREYLKRINTVLNFIENNLDTNLSLEFLAKKAHYSAYHFHRVFLTVVNERLNEYVNRKRIERIASILLVNPNPSLKELAYKYGFNSDNSFSRAFKKYYDISPTGFKSEGKELLSKIGIEPFSSKKYICSIDNIKQWTKMNAQITIKELPELKLACISNIGHFEKAGSMFQKLMEWGHKKKLLSTLAFKAITIYHDNPNVTQISKVRYSACILIDKDIDEEGEIRPFTIPKGNYVIGNFEIEANDFPKAWKSMSIWVLENNYEFRDGVYFEVYLNDHKTHPEKKFIIDICIPIEKLNKSNNLSNNENLSNCKNQTKQGMAHPDYHQLINYMKEIKTFFDREYQTVFKLGAIYKGNPDFSYFSLTTDELKKQKLKFVLIFNHKKMCFNICLSGQNKSIRKKYWKLFKDSSWNKYHLAASIDDSLSIIDYTIVEEPNFDDTTILIKQIETKSFEFINEIRDILE